MANLDTPLGFLPYLPKDNKDVVKNPYTMSSTATAVKRGDVVMKKSDGFVDIYDGSNSVFIVGVASHNATAGQIVYLWDDLANQKFYAQCDDTTGTLTVETCVNLNASILRTASGSELHSMFEIDESSGDVTNTLELNILGLLPAANNAFGQFNKLIVKFNNHSSAPLALGV